MPLYRDKDQTSVRQAFCRRSILNRFFYRRDGFRPERYPAVNASLGRGNLTQPVFR